MKIIITSESTCDMPESLKEKYGFKTLPVGVNLGEKEGLDGVDVFPETIFNFVAQTGVLPKTSAINTVVYEEFFGELLKEYDAIIHVGLSSEVSSCLNNARIASEKFDNVRVIDSRSLSTGVALLMLSAMDKVNAGKDIGQIVAELEEEVERVQASFVICNLKYLHKGGRCSGVAVFGANLLKIKPTIELKAGKLEVGKKYKGRFADAVLEYTDEMITKFPPNYDRVFITYSSAEDSLVNTLREKLIQKGFKEVVNCTAGATICSHCGPETLGIMYISEQKD